MTLESKINRHVGKYLTGAGIEFVANGTALIGAEKSSVPRALSVVGKYNYVICIDELCNCPRWQTMVKSWWNALTPGGALVFILPDSRTTDVDKYKWSLELKEFSAALLRYLRGVRLETEGIIDSFGRYYVVLRKPGEVVENRKAPVAVERELKKLPPYTVVIPMHGKPELTDACVGSIIAARWEPQDIVVVDDGSPTPYVLPQGVTGRVVRRNKQGGFPASMNTGVAASETEFVIGLNNDVTVYPDGDKGLLSPLGDLSVGMTGQKGGKLSSEFAHAGEGSDYVEMFCFGVRKSVWDRVGGLDEGMGLGYGEDSDFGIRLRNAGYSLKLGVRVCEHAAHGTFGRSPDVNALIEKNRLRLKSKYDKPKVLFVVASLGVSGGIKVIWNCAKAMRDAGWNTSVMLNQTANWTQAPSQWNEFTEFVDHRDKREWDMVVATFHSTFELAASILAKRHVALVQSDEPEWYAPDPTGHRVVEKSFRTPGFECVIVADYMRSFEKKYGMNVIGKIDNGVDNLLFYPEGLYKRVPTNSVLAIRKGSKCWFDGQEHVDAAMNQLAEEIPGIKYMILGSWKSQLTCKYEMLQSYNPSDINSFYNRAGVYVIPSKIEGSSLTVIEAWATGTPVVCTPIASDFLVDGENCLLFDYGDEDAIRKNIKRLLTNPKLWYKLHYNGIKLAQTLTLERQREQWNKVVLGSAK